MRKVITIATRSRAKTTEQFIEESKRLHPGKYTYDDTIYKSAKVRVILGCIECNKSFMARPTDHTSKMYGCPPCSAKHNKSEKMAVGIVVKILNCEFKPAAPLEVPWLKGLYLDGYSKEMKLGLEYQGIQHTKYPNFFHRTEDAFIRQQCNDVKKVRRCTRNGIKLLLIPHTLTYKNYEKMHDMIFDFLKKNNLLDAK